MTTLRHRTLDAQNQPIAGQVATVSVYDPDVPAGRYRRTKVVSAISGPDGWLTWTLPAVNRRDGKPATYVVVGIEDRPVLVTPAAGVSTATVGESRTGTLPVTEPSQIDLVTEDELADRLTGLTRDLADSPELRAALGTYAAVVGAGQFVTDGTDDHVQFQAAIDAVAARPRGGVVFIRAGDYTCGTVTLKRGVSLLAEKGAVVNLKAGAGTFLISEDFATAAGSGNAWDGISGFFIEGLTVDGNAASQPNSGAADYRGRNALIKLCGYNFSLRDLRLNDAREISLYTEHTALWNDNANAEGLDFNHHAFGESTFENLYIKNYQIAGWVNRGPHDSHAKSVYICSLNPDVSAQNGYVGQYDTTEGRAFSSAGFVADNMHVWGDHSDSSIWLDGANITQGKVYAEGAQVAAIRITAGGGGNNFEAVVDWAPTGILIEGEANDNQIEVYAGGSLTSSVVKLRNSSGNRLDVKHGAVWEPGGALFDLTQYTGGNNTFITGRPWGVAFYNGAIASNDRVDAVTDNFPENTRVTRWRIPVADTYVEAANAGFDIGTLPLIMGGRQITWGTAAPTSGTWTRGAIRFNSAPAAGGPMGWMCVTAGTPGTWKAMANLAA